jgi:hypothetical protein
LISDDTAASLFKCRPEELNLALKTKETTSSSKTMAPSLLPQTQNLIDRLCIELDPVFARRITLATHRRRILDRKKSNAVLPTNNRTTSDRNPSTLIGAEDTSLGLAGIAHLTPVSTTICA